MPRRINTLEVSRVSSPVEVQVLGQCPVFMRRRKSGYSTSWSSASLFTLFYISFEAAESPRIF